MKNTHSSALTALPPSPAGFGATSRRDRQSLLAVALVGALGATMAQAQPAPGYSRPLTLAPAEPAVVEGGAAENTAELTKKLQNPISSLISVPIQNNFDFGAGPKGDGFQYLVRIQPVIPISLGEDWNVISRTILPVVYQQNYIGTTTQSGLSDTLQSFFFSPKALWRGWTWGAGPVFQLPTATDSLLGMGKWGAGPTAVVLKQSHGWTYGMLANHVWSFAGWGDNNVNNTFLQPFAAYTLKSHTTFALNSESTYNWNSHQWTVPLNMTVKQVVKIGGAPIQFEFGPRYYAVKPDNGPNWGLRFTVTFLFPQ
jgi:hypothetical protein